MGNYSGLVLSNAMLLKEGPAATAFQLIDGDWPASGSYIDVGDCERFHVIARLGTIHASDTVTIEIKQATGASATLTTISTTNAKITATAAHTGDFAMFTIETKKLTEDYHYVAATVDGATNGSYGTVFFLLQKNELPVTQSTSVLPTALDKQFVGAAA